MDSHKVSLPELRNAILAGENQRRQESREAEQWAESLWPHFLQFAQQHPDFVASEQNIDRLVKGLLSGEAADLREVYEGKVTADNFHAVHAVNVYQNVYEPVSAPDPQTMPLERLRAEASGETAPDPEYAKPLEQLRQELYQAPATTPAQPEPVPTPTSSKSELRAMPLAQLREVAGASHGT